ncbi:energy-coupling factor transporter ATP-binding protein EcfA2 [Streptomyces zagrosensis]|uniref:Energy-coupling factor transporter ATP-binding protein EcfA2 n=1 Tax=Streptomyces zagrosensis TaxID=1042984 RepID=A0A7W9QD95_9ACTN|nr:energy-coupling factor transporter ATP-binding protein EcfA2 [Streptomyces zagrosensis]
MDAVECSDVLLIGGRSGVGKSTVAWEVSALLQAAGTAHCLIEGDLMDQIHPAPPDDPDRSAITERNLAAVWANYAALGQRRLVYTNTVSILEGAMFRRVLGEPVRLVPLLLTAQDTTAAERLAGREIGSQWEPHVQRSAVMARHLAEHAPAGTVRVATDGRSVPDIARDVVAATGWAIDHA